jgi:UDP-N-acetyl-D-galactosamine dehydrogenase
MTDSLFKPPEKDKTLEVEPEELRQAKRLRYATDPDELAPANVSILTVPTPIDAHKRPDPITL